ncbi:MAG TPA: hypothetical protein VMW87_11445 [Spirochaetia bacterium]|nr:hypothetical protein [Spirochaetia bacterium]
MAKKQSSDKGKKVTQTAKRGKTVSTASKKGCKPADTKSKSTSPPKKTAPDAKPAIVKQIGVLLGKMDENGLKFIRQQAEIIVTAGEFEEVRRKTMSALAQLQGAPAETTAPDAASVERVDDSFFNISIRGKRVFFNINELRAITKICHASPNGKEAARRLVAWFARERADFLNETGIGGPTDPALPKLWETIVNTYKLKT